MASPETGSEKHRDMAREVVLTVWLEEYGDDASGPDSDTLTAPWIAEIAAALARVEAETLERAARLCEESAGRDDAATSRAAEAGRNNVASHRQSDATTAMVLASAIRALAPEPVAGDAQNESRRS